MKNAFVDSNILAYAADGRPAESAKAKIARSLLEDGSFHLSVQVINEFIAVATHPKKLGMSRKDALLFCDLWRSENVVHSLTEQHCELARVWYEPGHLSWWDSLIIASANLAECDQIYTEDLSDGQKFGDTQIVNPFSGLTG